LFDSDGTVVAAVKAGNTDAFRILVDRHKARLYAVLMTLTADPDTAEELAQETFVKAFTGIDTYRADACFGTWLIQIAIHAARDHRRRARRERRRSPLSLDDLPESQRNDTEVAVTAGRSSDPAARTQAREEAAMVQGALGRLPPEYREVLVLKHFEGWSYEDIARISDETPGTVKVRAHRARRMLRDALRELDPFPRKTRRPPRTRRMAGAMRSHHE